MHAQRYYSLTAAEDILTKKRERKTIQFIYMLLLFDFVSCYSLYMYIITPTPNFVGWNEGGYPEIKEEPGSPGLSTVSNGSGQCKPNF